MAANSHGLKNSHFRVCLKSELQATFHVIYLAMTCHKFTSIETILMVTERVGKCFLLITKVTRLCPLQQMSERDTVTAIGFLLSLKRDNSSLKTCYSMLLIRELEYQRLVCSSKYFSRASELNRFLQLL